VPRDARDICITASFSFDLAAALRRLSLASGRQWEPLQPVGTGHTDPDPQGYPIIFYFARAR